MSAALDHLYLAIEQLLGGARAAPAATGAEVQIEIAERLTALLNASEEAFAESGILGAAFLFSDSGGEGWSLFERRTRQDAADAALWRAVERVTSVSTPYVVRLPVELASLDKALRQTIHHLFVDARRIQGEAVAALRAEPEFFAWLPRADRASPFPWEQGLRDRLGIHYVGAGEMTIALLTWRALQALAGQAPTQVHLSRLEGSTAAAAIPRRWLQQQLTGISKKAAGPLRDLVEGWVQGQPWHAELHRLASDSEGATSVRAVASRLGVTLPADLRRAEPAALAALVDRYCRVVCGVADGTASNLLLAYERSARAPLPAYYYWQLIEGRSHAHLVAPVWTSALNPLRLRAEEAEHSSVQPAVGLALAAVDPIAELESQLGSGAEQHERFRDVIGLIQILRQISRPLVEFVFYEPVRRREREAQANQLIAAIMSRNLSHNIGSHVLYHLREELDARRTLAPTVSDPRLREELRADGRIADLIKYLQARMDFIALVSSESVTWPSVVTLERLRAPFEDPDGLLLKHIVKSQKAEPPRVTIRTLSEARGGDRTDVDFAIPTGAVGAQAVYSIIENFVRNSAKYGRQPLGAPLQVEILIDDLSESDEHFSCTLSDNNHSVLKSACYVRDSFDAPLFDATDPGKSSRNWGLKEIKIASLYLLGGVEAVRTHRANLGHASAPEPEWLLTENDGKTCRLSFRFYLMKPLGMCLVGGASAECFDSAPLLHVRRSATELLRDDFQTHRRYEMVVADGPSLEGMDPSMASALRERGMRLCCVGPLPRTGAFARDPGVVSIAETWHELADTASRTEEPPWQVIGARWVETCWPGRTTVYAASESVDQGFVPLVELHRREFTHGEPDGDLSRLLVWDHTAYPESDRLQKRSSLPLFERFGFHRPVSHPFHAGLDPRDGPWRLKEAACLQIGILDERIWGSRDTTAKDQGYKKLPSTACELSAAWRRAGVHFLDVEIMDRWDLPSQDRHLLLNGNSRAPAAEPFDMLVVHRSLIDRAATDQMEREHSGADPAGRREEIVGAIMRWLAIAGRRLIITSGRGLEPAYRDVLRKSGAGFVEFSAIADALIDAPGDKVGLVRLLRSI